MGKNYFNYTTHWPEDWFARRSFLRAWWRLYAGDPHWAPPAFPTLAHLGSRQTRSLCLEFHARPLYLEAFPRRSSSDYANPNGPTLLTAYFEEPVAASIVQIDRRRTDGTAYLSLLRCTNDEEALERLLGTALEYAGDHGCDRLIGPTGPTPAWQSGALLNYYHVVPPLHTAYNPPYLPEVLGSIMEPLQEQVLFEVAVPVALPDAPATAELVPFEPQRLSTDLLPLLGWSLGEDADFPSPGAAEAVALLRWLGAYPMAGWVAMAGGSPVGFILVQPDLAGLMQRTGGGRMWPWRWVGWLRRTARVAAGRVLLAAVAPAWRGQGIGRQLWRQAFAYAQTAGWRTLTCGPVAPESYAAQFLASQGAHARQRTMLYAWTAW